MKKHLVTKILIVMALFFTTVTFAEPIPDVAATTLEYEFYPKVQKVVYGETKNDISDLSSYVISDNLDEATVKHLLKTVPTLKSKDELNKEIKQVIISLKGDGDSLETYIIDNYKNDLTLEEHDAYYLDTTKGIVIYAKDTDAAFHAITTLGQALDQVSDNKLLAFEMSDYSDTALRGFIEGFYGVPWSNEDRMELMRFGGKFKMNAYLFAPKDDPYHNQQWRTPYPKEKLDELKEMIAVGNETKNRFIWTIHPLMHEGIRFDSNYDNDLKAIITKFEQLYEAGVRQFGVLADDVDQAAMNPTNQLRLMKDIHAWNATKTDNYSLIFVPSVYNNAWVSSNRNYFTVMNSLPSDIHVMWTGNSVLGSINQNTVNNFQALMPGKDGNPAREPFFWLNWPVNDINSRRLVLGKSEMLTRGVKNLDGVVTNPMQQAEASKGSLFTIADYGWNTDEFDVNKNWNDSFKYIEGTAHDSLRTIAEHLNDPSPNGHGVVYKESENIKPLLDAYIASVNSNSVTLEKTDELLGEFKTILDATVDFKKNAENTRYVDEIEPWIDALHDVAAANIAYLNTKRALLTSDIDQVWSNFSKGLALEESSKNYIVSNLHGPERVESGVKRLVPFMSSLNKHLSPIVDDLLRPEIDHSDKDLVPLNPKIIKSADFIKIYEGRESNIFNSNDSQYVWYNTYDGKVSVGAYYGLDLGQEVFLASIVFKQGTLTNTDMFNDAYLEVSLDGVNWDRMSGPYNSKNLELNLASQNIKARYVRFVNTVATQKWYVVREFQVTGYDVQRKVYTNSETQKNLKLNFSDDEFVLDTIQSITLNPNEYIGFDLERVREIESVQTPILATGLKVHVGKNPIELHPIEDHNNDPLNARYVTIKNTTDKPVTLPGLKFTVKTKEFGPLRVTETNIGAFTNTSALFDKNLSTKASSASVQKDGDYFVSDLGQEIKLDSLKFVISDTETNYINNAKVSVSQNGSDYVEVGTLGNGSDGTNVEVYPEKDVAFLSKTFAGINKTARYVKVEMKNANRAISLNEIVINDGQYIRPINNPSFTLDPIEAENHRPEAMFDNDFNTYFVPEKHSGSGSMVYEVSSHNNMNEITILQSSNRISNATVSVRTLAGWEDVGTLDKTYNLISLKETSAVLQIKIAWNDGANAPIIYEIYTNIGLNKKVLNEAIELADKLSEADYTPVSWNKVAVALREAKLRLISNKGTQAEVDAAVVKLNNAVKDLVLRADISILKAMIADTADYSEIDYAKTSWKEFKKQLTLATAVASNFDATQEVVDQMVEDLKDAIENLVNISEINKLMNDIKLLDGDLYVRNTWKDLTDYLRVVRRTLELPGITQAEADVLLATLTEKYGRLELIAEIGDLISLIEAVEFFESLVQTDYEASSYAAYLSSIKKARVLIESNSSTQTQVTELLSELEDHYVNLVIKKLNLSNLDKLKVSISKLNHEGYTTSSWNRLEEAIAMADEYALDTSALQSELDKKVLHAQRSLDRLVVNTEFDVDALIEAIARGKAIEPEEYTAESFDAMTHSLKDAQALLDLLINEEFGEVTQDKIDEHTLKLNEAIENLVIKGTPVDPDPEPEPEPEPEPKPEEPEIPVIPEEPKDPSKPGDPTDQESGLPATGVSTNNSLLLIGLMFVVLGVSLKLRRKKEREAL